MVSLRLRFCRMRVGLWCVHDVPAHHLLKNIFILAAYSHSPAVANALVREMQSSLPFDLAFINKYIPQSFSKAYRFVREMEEMSGFVHANVDSARLTNKSKSKSSEENSKVSLVLVLPYLYS